MCAGLGRWVLGVGFPLVLRWRYFSKAWFRYFEGSGLRTEDLSRDTTLNLKQAGRQASPWTLNSRAICEVANYCLCLIQVDRNCYSTYSSAACWKRSLICSLRVPGSSTSIRSCYGKLICFWNIQDDLCYPRMSRIRVSTYNKYVSLLNDKSHFTILNEFVIKIVLETDWTETVLS